ncbi:ABC transporter substrate-binding protein [Mesorhizobium sp. AR07]|uniref:ABC transporter substrate-binding protein n=1 Tax=Mesorhizobium sp. AR07 TaxID=2865838 RepID=UPI00215EF182|nr:ABC transporter substrate-binding protein [Mesorhizobium sp. AR07]UVK43874.1 ABC transporter substrate-binding protein [Mesorhizobium sp. AR07]
MSTTKWLSGIAIAALGFAGWMPAAFAAAGDECVKILGYEWSGEKQSMDPADMHSGDDAYHTFAVYNRLVDIDDNFNVLPELATEWSVSPDGLSWTFKLRQGVKFHSGKDFSSADVVWSFKRLLDPKTGSGAQAVLEFLDPDGITAPDPSTVVFTTKKPVVELPVLITNKFTNIVPNGATGQTLRLHEDGTGPFMQEQFTPNAPVRILRKNPNYWKAGEPKSDCLRITVAQEAVAAVSAMKAGQIDLMLNVDPSVISSLKDDPSVQLLQTAASNSMTISAWVDTPPFDNPKVREAMKAVVDRQAMVDTVLLGFGEPGADNPVPVGSPASYTKEAPKQDIELAKKLLAEAGYKDGLKFDLYTAEGVPGMVLMAQVYAEMAKPAGFDINVIVTPADSFWDDVWLKKSITTSAWSMRPPGEGLATAYTQNAKWKETHWERPDYDALLLKANTTVDPAERNKLFQQTGELLAKEGGLVLPMFVHQVLALRKGCEGYTPRAQNFNLNFETLSCK